MLDMEVLAAETHHREAAAFKDEAVSVRLEGVPNLSEG